jgi:hypothetical protein
MPPPPALARNTHERQHNFLGLLGRPPARLDAEQTAWALDFRETDIAVLVKARLLKPFVFPSVTRQMPRPRPLNGGSRTT